MVNLVNTSEKLELVTSSTSSIAVVASGVTTASGATTGVFSEETAITTATTTDIVAAPGSGEKILTSIFVRNQGTTANTVSIQKDVSATNYPLTPNITLDAGESLQLDKDDKIIIYDVVGRQRTVTTETSGYNGRIISFYKVGTTAEAVGVRHSLHAATGFPGAWAPGTPGLAGRTTDGTTTTDGGCLPYVNPSSGSNYLTYYGGTGTLNHYYQLCDILWVNSGIVVTTTTSQTINSVAFPARDSNGSTNGENVQVGILVTTATTNAGAITNTTMSYTDSDGNAGNTATISSFPATAVAGTFVPFQLAAGDRGIRSIQSITLGTSYGGGAISLIAFRDIAAFSPSAVNIGGMMNQGNQAMNPGIKLYNGTCLILYYIASATTATNYGGAVTIMER